MGQSKERNSNEKSGFLKKLIIVLAVAIVVVFAVFYVIYYRFSYQADKLAKETARIYAFGDGGEMADMIAPGYVKKFEDSSKVLSVSDIQDIYINKFRAYTEQQFADNGVKGVSQYRSVEADWIVTGKDGGEVTVHVQECMLKCDDGWYVDYVRMPDEIDSMSTPVDSGDADSEETTEAESTE